jgi:hypothetical protein
LRDRLPDVPIGWEGGIKITSERVWNSIISDTLEAGMIGIPIDTVEMAYESLSTAAAEFWLYIRQGGVEEVVGRVKIIDMPSSPVWKWKPKTFSSSEYWKKLFRVSYCSVRYGDA